MKYLIFTVSFLNKYLIILATAFLAGCSSLSLYKEADCDIPPEHYGQCYADLGYRAQAYETMAKYCEGKGRKIWLDKFRESHSQRLTTLCSQAHEVFTLEFRTAAGLNGPETCPETLLTSEELKKAAKDGRFAGYAYRESEAELQNAKGAEVRREKADKEGFWAGLWDRALKTSADQHQQFSVSNSEKSEKLRKLYPKATALTTVLKCTQSGHF